MEQEEGIVISEGPKVGLVRSPGKPTRMFSLSDAPAGLKRFRSVRYNVTPKKGTERYDTATDIQLMDVV